MTPFTEDEIKTLRRELDNTEHGEVVTISMPASDLRALLARMEAAEACIDNPHHFSHHYPENNCKGCVAIQTWRKAAGK